MNKRDVRPLYCYHVSSCRGRISSPLLPLGIPPSNDILAFHRPYAVFQPYVRVWFAAYKAMTGMAEAKAMASRALSCIQSGVCHDPSPVGFMAGTRLEHSCFLYTWHHAASFAAIAWHFLWFIFNFGHKFHWNESCAFWLFVGFLMIEHHSSADLWISFSTDGESDCSFLNIFLDQWRRWSYLYASMQERRALPFTCLVSWHGLSDFLVCWLRTTIGSNIGNAEISLSPLGWAHFILVSHSDNLREMVCVQVCFTSLSCFDVACEQCSFVVCLDLLLMRWADSTRSMNKMCLALATRSMTKICLAFAE